jgi:DNA-binding MarR family transcriptional regulator
MTAKKSSGERSSSDDRSRVVDTSLLKRSISFLIYRAHRATAHAWVARFGEGGMRYGYFNAFVLIGANPGILVVELAELLGIDKSRASELVDAMEKDRLVSRRRLVSDQRSLGTYLTPDAASKLAALIQEVGEHERRAIDALYSEDERRVLTELLGRVAALP